MSLPYMVYEDIWTAKAATATVVLREDFSKCCFVVYEIATTGFSGTIDFQGRASASAFANVPYVRSDQATPQIPSVAQLSLTLDTGVYRYVSYGTWQERQVVMTRTAGSITAGVFGTDSPAQMDMAIRPVRPITVSIATATTGAISKNVAPAVRWRLNAVRCKFSGASTATENFTITLNAGDGAVYDTTLFSQDLKAGGITSLVVKFGGDDSIYEADDSVDVAYTNTSAKTYGLAVVYESV